MSSHISHKYLIPLVIAVLAVAYLAAASAYSIWPFQTQEQGSPSTPLGTTGDTASWKTYRNQGFGFEVKYPDEWELIDNGEIMPASYRQRCEYDVQYDIDGCTAFGIVGGSEKIFTYFEVGTGELKKRKIIDLPKHKFNGKEFRVLYNEFEGVGTNYYFALKSNGEYLGLYHRQRYDKEKEENGKIINQILSTFRFIK